jgi:hypothetical protein
MMIIALLAFLSYNLTNAQDWIYNKEYPEKDTLYIDILKLGDSASINFIIKHQPTSGYNKLRIGSKLPSLFFGESKGHPREWEEFGKYYPDGKEFLGDVDVLNDSSIKIRVQYKADSNLVTYPYGKKEMMLILGLYDPAIEPVTDKDLIVVDTFIVWAKKTPHYVEAYENVLDFDSVYVYPSAPASKSWNLKNISTGVESITKTVFKDSSDKKEFVLESPELPLELIAGSPQSVTDKWKISYRPVNHGRDSAYIEIDYSPKPADLPANTANPYTKVYGYGVEQKITLIDAGDNPFTVEKIEDTLGVADSIEIVTIYAGDVRLGTKKTIRGIVRNDGNIPFGATKQEILFSLTNSPSVSFQLKKELSSGRRQLLPSLLDTFLIEFAPVEIGDSLVKFEVTSDISGRNIFGISPYARKLIFHIKGKGTLPIYSVESDTLDLGNIVIGCPRERKSAVYINNEGNEDLVIRPFIKLPSPFRVEPVELLVKPFSADSLILTYKFYDKGDFVEELKLTTNENPPNDSRVLYLSGEAVPMRSAKISMPDISAKPGSLIDIPIIVSDNTAGFANKFTDTIVYNGSLLVFIDGISGNTASEGAEASELTDIRQIDKDRISVSLSMPEDDQYFKFMDTLVFLRFKVYLGDKITSPVTFTNPVFSDAVCAEVFSINPQEDIINGSITLDSVCGLQYKAYDRNGQKFSFDEISPNPGNDIIVINLGMAFRTRAVLNLYDAHGNLVNNILDAELPSGTYQKRLNITEMSPGAYYIRFTAGIYTKTLSISIIR